MTDAALVAGRTGAAPATDRRCKFARVVGQLAPAAAARVDDLLHLDADDPQHPGWTDTALSKALARLPGGDYVTPSLLSRHRTGDCICTTRTTTSEDR